MSGANEDPKYWKDPKIFNPGRWQDAEFVKNLPKNQYLPFSMGKRACLGRPLAVKTMKIFLAKFFDKFDFVPPKNYERKMTYLPGAYRPDNTTLKIKLKAQK